MATKTPVLVTAAEWKKARAVTLKEPGLEKKLADWEKAKAELGKEKSIAAFQKCAGALKDVVTTAKTAETKCNKTLHKDTIAFLQGYPAAVAKISKGLQKEGEDYSKETAAWNKVRVDLLAGMKQHEATGKKVLAKFDKVKTMCESAKGTPDAKRSVALAKTELKELKQFKDAYIKTLDVWRIPTTFRPAKSDQDPKNLARVEESRKIQDALEHAVNPAIAYLEQFIKEN